MSGLLKLLPHQIKGRRFAPSMLEDPSGRVTYYEPPRAGRVYAAGADAAKGLSDGDFDTLCIFDVTAREESGRAVQVCQAKGHWGVQSYKVWYALLRMYNDAFLVAETQGGGSEVLNLLWNDMGYRRLYLHAGTGKEYDDLPENAKLGFPATADDLIVNYFRRAVQDRTVLLRDPELLEQMTRLQYAPPKTADKNERLPDGRFGLALPGGGSPDLMMAAAYGWFAVMRCPLPAPEQRGQSGELTLQHPDRPVQTTAAAANALQVEVVTL